MTAQLPHTLQHRTPIPLPLATTLNNRTSSQVAHLAAYQESLPWSIVLLLLLSAVTPAFLLGQQQAEATKFHFTGTICFILLVGLVIYVVLDLNQPTRGLIQVNLE